MSQFEIRLQLGNKGYRNFLDLNQGFSNFFCDGTLIFEFTALNIIIELMNFFKLLYSIELLSIL